LNKQQVLSFPELGGLQPGLSGTFLGEFKDKSLVGQHVLQGSATRCPSLYSPVNPLLSSVLTSLQRREERSRISFFQKGRYPS